MSDTVRHFRKPSPQPWKLEVPKPLDLEEEFNPSEDNTTQFHVTEPDDYMNDLEFEDAVTGVWDGRG